MNCVRDVAADVGRVEQTTEETSIWSLLHLAVLIRLRCRTLLLAVLDVSRHRGVFGLRVLNTELARHVLDVRLLVHLDAAISLTLDVDLENVVDAPTRREGVLELLHELVVEGLGCSGANDVVYPGAYQQLASVVISDVDAWVALALS